jgi:hypothetical protein
MGATTSEAAADYFVRSCVIWTDSLTWLQSDSTRLRAERASRLARGGRSVGRAQRVREELDRGGNNGTVLHIPWARISVCQRAGSWFLLVARSWQNLTRTIEWSDQCLVGAQNCVCVEDKLSSFHGHTGELSGSVDVFRYAVVLM